MPPQGTAQTGKNTAASGAKEQQMWQSTNKNFANAPYWDFKVKSTLECTINAQIDPSKNAGSGCAVILIGFKQK